MDVNLHKSTVYNLPQHILAHTRYQSFKSCSPFALLWIFKKGICFDPNDESYRCIGERDSIISICLVNHCIFTSFYCILSMDLFAFQTKQKSMKTRYISFRLLWIMHTDKVSITFVHFLSFSIQNKKPFAWLNFWWIQFIWHNSIYSAVQVFMKSLYACTWKLFIQVAFSS